MSVLSACSVESMATAYENLRKQLQLGIRQLKEIKQSQKPFEVEEFCSLENDLTDLITVLLDAQKQDGP